MNFGFRIFDFGSLNPQSAIRIPHSVVENKGVEPLTLPTKVGMLWPFCQFPSSCKERLVENKGVEPLTPCVQGRCSGQLS